MTVLTFKFPALATKITYLLFISLFVFSFNAFSQRDLIRDAGGRFRNMGGAMRGGGGGDSLKRRDRNEDSITIRFKYLDSTRNYLLDSSVADFTRRFPVPATYITLGNTGSAARSILFSPLMRPGWDPGFHAYDIYKWTIEKARFFHTTRPYSELNYQLASRSEQIIELMHTQNRTPNWNLLLQYRLINSPGFFKNQKTNHNSYLITSHYETVNRRYNNYFILASNKLQAGESGGLDDTQDYMNDPDYKDRFAIPTRIGGDQGLSRNFFNTDVGTGNRYNEMTILFRQQYDLGKKDSLVTDSTVIPLFFPRLRFEHTFQYGQSKYQFRDVPYFTGSGRYEPDSAYYQDNYGITVTNDTIQRKDQWKFFSNDFSVYQFPDAKNLHQFIKIGATLENIKKELPFRNAFYNVFGHAEYRNRTRNQKWDMMLNGKLYFVGLNAGDYYAYASLQRSTGGKIPGYAQIGFENVNRTPSFIFDNRSDFYLGSPKDFKKENTAHLFASLFMPSLRLRLTGHYYLLTNYTYIANFHEPSQHTSVFNTLRVSAEKTIKLGKRWFWHADVYFQQVVGNAPVNLPLIFTRNRIAYEGSLGLKNLNLATGIELRYHTPYKADGYSPLLGQFFYQENVRINNPMPDITAYIHFRIRPFKAYLRFENLNTAEYAESLSFTNNNREVPGYPYPGLLIRLGIYWSFVN